MSKSSDLDTQHLLSPDEERVPSYGSTRYAAINASISSRSSSEDGTGEGERVWIVACFSVIACVSSVLNGLVLGYSSGTLIELKKIYQKGDTIHGFLDTSTYASLFGASGSLRCSLCCYIGSWKFSLVPRPSTRAGLIRAGYWKLAQP